MKFGWKQTLVLLMLMGILAVSPYFLPEIDLNTPSTAEEFLEAGKKAQRENNHWQAEDFFSKVIEEQPDNGEAYFLRGATQLQLNYLDRAIKDFSRALQLDPSLVNAYFNRGTALAKKGLYQAAVDDFTKSLELRPDDVEALRERGLAKEQGGDRFGAIEDYERAIDLNEEYALAHLNLGLLQLELNLTYEGLSHLNEAIAKQPDLIENFQSAFGCGPAWDSQKKEVIMDSTACPD